MNKKYIQRSINTNVGRTIVSVGGSRPVAEIFARRFDSEKKAIETYFASLKPLQEYQNIKDVVYGGKIIADVLNSGGIVALISDSDCDGQSCANILSRFAFESGWRNRLIILTPNRLTDGYGANPDIVDIAIERGADIIVTADNGIMAYAAASRAKEMEIPFIVTDHHQPGKSLPEATAIINPARKDCGFADGILCGASVLYMLVLEIRNHLKCNHKMIPLGCDMWRLIQILAFATIADCVPLNSVNRAIVTEGLKILRDDPYPPFKAYFESKKVSGNCIDVETISFGLAPMANSVGRLGSAGPAIDFLCSDNASIIQELITSMSKTNEKRKSIQEDVLTEAKQQVKILLEGRPDTKIIVVGKKEWHHGVVGIVAGRLAESTRRPVIVFGGSQQDECVLKGSGRAGESDLHLKKLLDDVFNFLPDALIGYGGHAKAAGMSLITDALPVFSEQVNLSAKEMGEKDPSPFFVDLIYQNEIKDPSRVFDWLNAGPFGQQFPSPSIVIENASINNFRSAKSDTAIFKIGNIKCIGFKMAKDLENRNNVSLIVEPRISYFRGEKSNELVVQAII